ncbi:MAG: tetratricopeptide repeat protein [Phycisphaerales bacterium]|nr:tetratricopeptide repeat protein [Phycisphaerales bacterium]
MAAKVNTKFVAILAGTLVLVFAGTTATWLWLKNKSGDDNERKGDVLMAAGNFEEAEKLYGKAVNRQRANVTRLEKWHKALSNLIPPTQTAYEQKFHTEYTMSTKELARLKGTDIAAHRAWLELLIERIAGSRFDTQNYLQVLTEVDNALASFSPPNPDGPEQILRRYSGLALVRIMASAPEVTDEQIKRAKEDLDAAAKADPKDVDVQLARVGWHSTQAGRANRARRPEQEKAWREQSKQLFAEVAAQFPDEPRVLVMGIREHVDQVYQQAGLSDPGLSEADRKARSAQMQEKIKAMTAELDAVADKLAAAKDLDSQVVSDFSTLELGIDPASKWARTQKIAIAQLQAHPENAMMHNLLAVTLGEMGQVSEGIAQYQKIIDLPPRPLSTAGLRLFAVQAGATIAQADLALQEWFTLEDDAKKQEVMTRVKGYRAKVAERGIRDDVPAVMLVDAKIKVSENEWAAANKLLVRFFDAIGGERHPDALLIHAQVLLQLNQPGAAMAAVNKLEQLEPNNLTAMTIHARALHALENKPEAIKKLEEVLALAPDNTEIQGILTAWREDLNPETISDPIARDLTMLGQPRPDGVPRDVVAELQALAVKYEYDPRIVGQLAQLLMEKNDKAGAADAVAKSIAKNPDNKGLQQLQRAISAEDTAGALIEIVDAASYPDEEKVVRKYAIMRSYERKDEASQLLKGAIAKHPNDPRLIELAFLEAIERRDETGANALAESAARVDADSAEGLTYRARVFIMQERLPDAAAILQQATSRRVVSPEVWRLLARVQARLGRDLEAVKGYQESLRLRPNDRSTLVEYIDYVAGFDGPRALQIANEFINYGKGDPTFDNIHLQLQGRVGDKNAAIEARKKLAETKPDDLNNLGSLATLYLDLKQYDTARTLIDKIKVKQDSVAITLLEARWYIEQRSLTDAKRVMEDYLARQDQSKLTIDPFLSFGQFLVQHNQPDEGLAMMDRARPFQEAKRAEVDRTLGDTLAGQGRAEAAAEAYERVLAAGGEDPKNLVHLRLAEMYARQEKFKEADEILTKMNAAGDKESATAILLAADCAAGVKDEKRARDLLNRAVATFPDDPLVYVKRAEFLAQRPEEFRDAMSDFDAALRVRPGFARALQMRAAIYLQRADLDKAFADLQALVRANPRMVDIRDTLISDLLKRERGVQAVQIADDAVAANPGDVLTLVRMSDLFRANEQWAEGARYARMAWEISKQYDVGIRYLDALLNDPAGNLITAADVLKVFQDEIASRPAMLISRAKLAARRNPAAATRNQQIFDDMLMALNLIPPERLDQLLAWRRDARRIFVQPRDAVKFYADIAAKSPLRDWALYFLADVLITTEATFIDGLKNLDALAQGAADENVRVLSHRLKGQAFLAGKKYQEAADAWAAGLKAYPEDWEMNNNIAFVLVHNLGKAEEALPYAEAAVKSNPTNADALDTLGAVYLALKRYDEADRMLEHAIIRAGSAITRLSPTIHMAALKLAQGDKEAAQRIVKEVEAMLLNVDRAQATDYRTQIEGIQKQIDAK